jgi:hypothetical protein
MTGDIIMKKGFWIVGSIVIGLILMGASFYGGTLYQKNQQSSAQAAFFASRGVNGGFGGPEAGTFAAGGGFRNAQGTPGAGRGFGGGTTGQVKSINGNTISLSTAQNVTTVTLSGATIILKSDPGTIADLKVGDRILVTGQRDSSGNVTASQITVLAAGSFGGPGNGGGPQGAVTPTP